MAMSDPVDTDALLRSIRTLVTQYLSVADEVDRLRAELAEGLALTKQYATDSARDKRLLERDVHHLRTAIENAPHAPECEQWDLQPQTGRPLTDVCTCWKADAL